MSLKEYRRKRKFDQTPEPKPRVQKKRKGELTFVIQKHAATRTHYDFRLELDGAMKSWAVPKGPSLLSGDPRLAVYVEDHPLEYGKFEGVIPKGNYGAGTVMIWDAGTYVERTSTGRADSEAAIREGMARGHITFVLTGQKLRGEFALVRIKNKKAEDNAWLLIKKHDHEASRRDVRKEDRSVATGRTMEEIALTAEGKGEIWIPRKGLVKKLPVPKKRISKKIIPKNLPKKMAMPRRVRLMQPIPTSVAPPGGGWIFESFGDGYRVLAEVESARVHLYSRSLLSFDRKYPAIVSALRKLKRTAIFDGEIVRNGKEFKFLIGDLLYDNGQDLRETSLRDRKKALTQISFTPPLHLAESADDAGKIKSAYVVAKRPESAYQSGLSRDWLRFRNGKGLTPAKKIDDKPPLTHPGKLFWPREGYTKGDLYHYYDAVSKLILPYLIDRPQSLHRQPDGMKSEGFFHKDMTSFLPKRVQTERVYSASSGRTINYALCQDRWSLLFLVNMGCIEFNPWLSRRGNLENPDYVVIDLDPDENNFNDVVKVAREVHRILESIGVESHCKTSGASGLHICIPTGGKFDFDVGREFAEAVCNLVNQKFPALTSVERNPAKRRRRIYLDFLQNRRGQTLAAPYCVRPREKATVSTPLKWSEVKTGLKPDQFTIKTILPRIAKVGDLWRPLLNSRVDIAAAMKRLSKRFHI